MAAHSTLCDRSGRPLKDAVASATPLQQDLSLPARCRHAVMAVDGFAFKPLVPPVRIGSGVSGLFGDKFLTSPEVDFRLTVQPGRPPQPNSSPAAAPKPRVD